MINKTLYMQTTGISAEKSASEISSCLIRAGASQIAEDYNNGQITGLRWLMVISGVPYMFSMPARVEPVYKILLGRRKGWLSDSDKDRIREQARRVAWRQLLRWVQSQLAMIEVGMVATQEVFLPYMQAPGSESDRVRMVSGNSL